MAGPDNTPSGVVIWLEEFIRDLERKASEEVLSQHFDGLEPTDVQLRLMFLAQMVASNTNTDQRKGWSVRIIADIARLSGHPLDLDE